VRPINLDVNAFGPFPGRLTLDFRELGPRTLFLIHGPTGAGKTTILDAICFALYGDSSSGDRPQRHMRSDHSEPDIATEVTFEFSLGSSSYRVFRRPEQQLPSKKRRGSATLKRDAVIWKLADGAVDPAADRVLATGWKDVSERVERLLGFRSDQFRQVVILPQGKFRDLLAADSNQREAILEVLFRTVFYREIEEALKDAAETLERNIRELTGRRQFILDQASVASERDLVESQERCAQELESLKGRITLLKKAATTAQEELATAGRALEKIRELDSAVAALTELERKADEFSVKRTGLANARRAAVLDGDEKGLKARIAESDEASKKLALARRALEEAKHAVAEAETRFGVEREREQDRQSARADLNSLNELSSKAEAHEAAGKEARQAAEQLKLRDKQLSDLSETLEESNAKLDEALEALAQARATASQLELLTARAQEGERNRSSRKRLEKLRQEEAINSAELERISAELGRVGQDLIQSREAYRMLENAWIEGQAGILARGLTPGEPCPVCGSSEHPAPAAAGGRAPDEEALKTGQDRLARLVEDVEALKEAKSQSDKKSAATKAAIEVIQGHLADLSHKGLKEMEAEGRKIAQQLKEAQEAQKDAERRSVEIQSLRVVIAETAKSFEHARNKRVEASERLQTAEAIARERLGGIPENLRAPGAVGRARTKTEAKIKQLDLALDKARQDKEEADKRFASCRTAVDAADDADRAAAAQVLNQKLEFTRRLQQEGFNDEEGFRQAKRTKAEVEKLEQDIRRFDSSLAACRDRAARAAEAAQGIERPDIEALEDAARKSVKEHEDAVRHEASLVNKLGQATSALTAFGDVSERLGRLEEEYAVKGRIAKVANGKNDAGVTFQRFVLATLLEDVLYTASERLRIMSHGRFSLHRSRERTDKRKHGGLDLEVQDAYTGTVRPVSTLSGGEAFLASLSLALGLADAVQAHAGGIHLETIFVDEGFGSLDEETLELAFRALTDLQRSGRLVGIISHVAALKEEIDTRLEVTAGRGGSAARFVVG
jgi:exonuclease SbcC